MLHLRTIGTLIVALAAVLAAGAASSQSLFEKLVMPGPLIEGHAKLEKDCMKCHEPFTRQSQTRLCLDCHKDVAGDRQQRSGFHGKSPAASTQDCRHCHSDHKGRAADVVMLDRQTFNHGQTDFALKGAHAAVMCDSCHKPKTKFRDAPGGCVDCHKSVDRHKGRLGTNCASCHEETAWNKAKPFDHAKTKFPLDGAHKTVTCSACHAGEHYKGLATTCVSCHQIQDKHAGRNGAKCETCHRSDKWSHIVFDHAKTTKFPLRGQHAKAKCESCHKGDLYKDKLATTCVSCHKQDDPHKGSLGTRCESCHAETGWRKKVAFDHDVTRFPLVGKHAVVPCESCHRTANFREAPRACASCHEDKHHQGRLSDNCSRCHNPNGWDRWRFDHATQTRYPLTGAHKDLQCHACHAKQQSGKVSAPDTCYGCHQADDFHRGSFGQACDTCHATTSFKQRGARR